MKRYAEPTSLMQPGRTWQKGFTLVELVVVVAIIGVLSAIVYPSYVSYTTKTRRVAAEACLSTYANFMERFYSASLRYDQDTAGTAISLPTLDCASASGTGSYYSYAFASGFPTATTYKLEATPQGAQASADSCGTLGLTQAGVKSKTGSGSLSDCW